MKPEMPDLKDKTTMAMPAQTVNEIKIVEVVPADSVGWKKRRMTRSHAVVATATAVVFLALIAGCLVGINMFLDSTNDTVKRTIEFATAESNRKLKEDVSGNVKDNIVEYHMQDSDKEVWVINDFNREIQVLKTKTQSGVICYVTPLNRSDTSLPDKIQNATAPTGPVDKVRKYVDILATPIRDKSMLGTSAQALCADIDVHWMTPTCDADGPPANPSNTSSVGRQKRYMQVHMCLGYCQTCFLSYHCSYGFFSHYCYWRFICYASVCLVPC